MSRTRSVLLLIACMASGLGAHAAFAAGIGTSCQTGEAEPGRPRIGLVLSGGGARGFAHVGVLKVLEELKIPIDCIAGTSVGAIVGGLYASGMDAHRIESLMVSLDWQNAFRDRPSRRELAFRDRKSVV